MCVHRHQVCYSCLLNTLADLSPDGRKGSFVGVRRLNNEDLPVPGADPPPTNEAVAQAVQEKVAVSVLKVGEQIVLSIMHAPQQ